MAITAAQKGLMAVGLLTVLFGADLLTLLGTSKVCTCPQAAWSPACSLYKCL